MSSTTTPRTTPEPLLARFEESGHAWLRIYIGAAPGVGKTYKMLQDSHLFRQQGVDVAIGMVETYGRTETEAQIKDLEVIPRRKIPYRSVILEEMDVEAIIRRRPQIVIVDELAHTNVPTSRNRKRYEDVLEILDAGIHVMTAVNIQHLETLNDAVSRSANIRVKETVPDSFLKRADEVVNVDVSIEELRTRLRQGKVYPPEKIEQSLTNFFRKGNLSTLRELALRTVAEEVGIKSLRYKQTEGLEKGTIPEKVMVCIGSRPGIDRVLRAGARIAGRLASKWYAVFVETPSLGPGRVTPQQHAALVEYRKMAEDLDAEWVVLKSNDVAGALIEFAKREGVTHVVFGQSARSRWQVFLRGSVINRFLSDVRDATIQVVPLEKVNPRAH